MKRRTLTILIVAGVVVVVVVIFFVNYASHFSSQVNPPHQASGAAKACGTAVPLAGLRIFQIVPNQTTASYSVHENLIIRNLPNNDAIGKTHNVQGNFRISAKTPLLVAGMKIAVDLTGLQSDSSQRDRYVQKNYLQTAQYPSAEFDSTCAQGLPASYSDGQSVTFKMVGNLTLHGKTNAETFTVLGKLIGNTITGTANTTVFMTDFGIQPPNIADFVVAENKTLITINFTAKEG